MNVGKMETQSLYTLKLYVCCAQSLSGVLLYVTLWTVPTRPLCPWDFQARILEWVAVSFSRDLPDPGIQSASPVSPAWQADSLSADPLGIPTFWLLLHICEPLFLCGRINVCGTHDNLFQQNSIATLPYLIKVFVCFLICHLVM